jgi:pimeloyl-ACP methyl ester carboxylesterase
MPLNSGIYYSLSQPNGGAQPWVVLIHGTGSSHLCWPAGLRHLPGCRVLAVDLPGHGRSVGLGEQSVAAYANQLIQFLNSMDIFQVILVGHSLGGAIALQAAIDHPARVIGLGLIACTARLKVADPCSVEEALKLFRQGAFGTNPDSAIVKQVRPGVLMNDFHACAQFDLRDLLDRVYAPVWLAVGSEDAIVPAAEVRALAAVLPDTQLLIVPGVGHMDILVKPQPLVDGLSQFIQQFVPSTSLHRVASPVKVRL